MPRQTSKQARERLVKALEEAKAPRQMIQKAKEGYYEDFSSPVAFPITQLVEDAKATALHDIASRAMQGEFDG